MGYETLLTDDRDGVRVVTVNRPDKLNALNARVLEDLGAAARDAAAASAVRAVVLTGAGEKAFIAGADIAELSQLDPRGAHAKAIQGQAVAAALERMGKPVIAAINGFALGGGCELALACHIRLASENAKLGQPEVKLGILAGFGGTQRLPRLVGRGAALELLLSGEMISAQEALRIGLVDRVVPAGKAVEEAVTLARTIAQRGPVAVRYTLDAVHRGLDVPLEEGLAIEAGLFGLAFATQDMREGTRAFLEKRSPTFEGK